MLTSRITLRTQGGLTLIELMIGVSLGLFLVAGVIGVFSTTLSSQGANLKSTRLNQELRTALDIMIRDIRRAGYWYLASSAGAPPGNLLPSSVAGNITLNIVDDDETTAVNGFSDFGAGLVGLKVIADGAAATVTAYSSASQASASVTNNFASTDMIREGSWMISNPFSDGTNDVTISGSCITYSYDQDDPATNASATAAEKTAVNNDERFGFRLINNAIEIFRYTSDTINCAAAASDDGWTPITTPAIEVTALTLSNASSRCVNLSNNASNCSSPSSGNILLRIREIDITLSGRLATDNSITRTFSDTVKLRNDKIEIQS